MSEIAVHPNKKLKTINAEFQEKFPYLFLQFFDPKSWEKARKAGGIIEHLDENLRICDIRTKKTDGDDEISIHGNTQVKNLEDSFRDIFGCYVQVCYYNSAGEGFYTSEDEDYMTISQCNEYCKKNGCLTNEDFNAPYDNSSVTTDQITLVMRIIHTELSKRIEGLEQPKPKQYAKGKNINSTREYWADIDDEYLEGLFLEWYPEEKEFNMGFSVLAPDKNRKEFKKNLAELCEEKDIHTYEYACYITYEKIEYNSFIDLDDKLFDDIMKLYNTVQDICKKLQ